MLLSFLPQLLSWLALLSTAAGAEEEGVATAPLVSAPAPAAFESDVAMAMPEALFVNRLMDGGGGGGGGDEFDSDEQLSAASGMAAAAAAVATSSTTSPSSSLLLSWSALLQRAETAPVFLSESAFSEVDATQLRLTSQVFVWMRRGGGDGEEEEEDVIEVTENYAVKGRPFVLPFATWHPAGGLTSTTGPPSWKVPLYERRQSLDGVQLEALTATFMPLTGHGVDEQGRLIDPKGVFVDMFFELQHTLNFTYTLDPSPDGSFGDEKIKGTTRANGVWNGMVGALQRREADIVLTFAITEPRSHIIDYAVSILAEESTLSLKRPPAIQPMRFWVMLGIFNLRIWIVIAVVILSSVFLFRGVRHYNLEAVHYPHDSEQFGFLNAFALSGMLVIQREYHDIQQASLPFRIAYLSANLFFVVIFSVFTAYLTSLATSNKGSVNIRTFMDVLDSPYQVASLKSSFYETMLKVAPKDNSLNKVYLAQMVDNDRAWILKGELILESLRNDSTLMFFATRMMFANYEDILTLDLSDSVLDQYGWGFQKGSEFVDYFSYWISKSKESGLVRKLVNNYIPDKSQNADSEPRQSNIIGYDNLALPVMILTFGIGGGVFFAAAEWLTKKGEVCRPKKKGQKGKKKKEDPIVMMDTDTFDKYNPY